MHPCRDFNKAKLKPVVNGVHTLSTMKDHIKPLLIVLVILSIGIITAVAFHSTQEIHYLKSFFPEEFTVQEAKDASIIELIKVIIISIPIIFLIAVCLTILKSVIK